MEVVFLRQPYKFIQKAKAELTQKIKEEILVIAENPEVGKKLSGVKFKHIYIYKFVFIKVHYRIAYTVKNNIIVVCIATRENFYKDLK